jgi:magnesium transporter
MLNTLNTLYLPELREMIAMGDAAGLREFTEALHAARVAEFMEGLDPQESWAVLQAADPATRVEVFGFFDEEQQVKIVESCGPVEASQLIADMPADDRVDLLEEVDDAIVEQVLPLMPAEERRDILRLREYPEGTAGSVMTTEMARIPETLSVREALEEIGRQSQELETIYYIYIVDEGNHLRGLVSARELVAHLGKPNTSVGDLMTRDLVTVLAEDDQEAVARKVASYDFLAIPVVDDQQHLLGIITHDDVIDVFRAEAEEDAYLAGAIDPLVETYLGTPWYTLAWKRGMWLFILSIAALLTVVALRGYEGQMERVTWLAIFLPLIISSGGNSGGQSATLVITSLTSGRLKTADWGKVLHREAVMGLSLGAFLAVLSYAYALLLINGPSPFEKLVIPITLMLVVIAGTLCGGALPLIFRRLGLDPALMSNPFVAGIIDVAGILIYMSVAALMLS